MSTADEAEAQSGIVLAEETGRPIAGARIVTQSRQVAARGAPGSTLAMSFMLPIELADPDVRPAIERAGRRSSASSRRQRC